MIYVICKHTSKTDNDVFLIIEIITEGIKSKIITAIKDQQQ